MSEPQKIFAVQHDANTRIGVTNEPQDGRASLVVSVYRTGADKPQRWRFDNPNGVTRWFGETSAANTEAWRDAYHKSGLTGLDFQSAQLHQIGDVQAEVDYREVPYHSQRDNELDAGGSCNVTSCAMALDFYGIAPLVHKYPQLEDNLNAYMKAHGLDRHSHGDLEVMMHAHGADASYRDGASLQDIRDALSHGWLCVVSGMFTSAGHIVCVIGTRGRDFIVHDPWGDFNAVHNGRHYRNADGSAATNGKARIYTQATMQDVLIDRRDDGVRLHVIKGKK